MLITRTSIISGTKNTIDLPIVMEDWKRYMDGELIQKCFPYLSNDEREFILTGITVEEWNETFLEEED